MNETHVTAKPIAAFPVSSVGEALLVMKEARELCLDASYVPAGGDTCRGFAPITHTVYVMGSPENIHTFQTQMEQK